MATRPDGSVVVRTSFDVWQGFTDTLAAAGVPIAKFPQAFMVMWACSLVNMYAGPLFWPEAEMMKLRNPPLIFPRPPEDES